MKKLELKYLIFLNYNRNLMSKNHFLQFSILNPLYCPNIVQNKYHQNFTKILSKYYPDIVQILSQVLSEYFPIFR